ncbi:hypothetical protein FRC10_010753 [Ceratobasidium sp. 414]|nr:hypothetical protein FRC10_010753 [Ceratobasidium sp. 414]
MSGSFIDGGATQIENHARVDAALGQARITHIQARKSRRPPFLHEYLLAFFTTSNDQRFVMRIDRLGKIGSTSGGGLLGWCAGRHGQASDIAIQQVGVYHIQDAQIGIDSPDGAWYAYDGRWGSEPIATLIIWSEVNTTTTQVSHHTQTATARDGPVPRLSDVSRLLEAILLEMPTYHLTTTNCYFMTRTSILLLQRCFPNSFACFMGSASGKLTASSELAEPVWAGLIRWYLPFVVTILALYDAYWYLSRVTQGLRLATHGIIDVPLPIGILHTWMTTLEVRMNGLVTRLSTEYHSLERGVSGSTLLVEPQPFGVASERVWLTLAAWCGIGLGMALPLVSNPWVVFGLFMTGVVIAVAFNLQYSDGDLLLNPENMFPVYPSEPISEPIPEPAPSSQGAQSQS